MNRVPECSEVVPAPSPDVCSLFLEPAPSRRKCCRHKQEPLGQRAVFHHQGDRPEDALQQIRQGWPPYVVLWVDFESKAGVSSHFAARLRPSLQVVGAKVVTNAKSPGARCYGFVTMSSTEEATKCISHLHRTELHGKMISVERVRTFD